MQKKLILLFLIACSVVFNAYSQEEEEMMERVEKREVRRSSVLVGKIVDAATNKGIEAASVQVLIPIRDAETGERKDSVMAGTFTRPNGDFSFTNIELPAVFLLRVTSIGYDDFEQIYQSESPDGRQSATRDLGNIALATSEGESLDEVTVVGARPQVALGIDRKVFNVEKNITATGGTAVDVMRNIPSLSVDIDGNVELRNSSPQIFIDGRPTILSLDQIPADDIERIELITNPSAKFDASSSGGIINIILKKNRKLGINGNLSLGIGTPEVLNGNFGLNIRQGKFNFFGSANYNQSGGVGKSEAYRINKSNGAVRDYFDQLSENDRSRRFNSVRFGLDFFLDNRNTFSFTQGFTKGKFGSEEDQRQQYYDNLKVLNRLGIRTGENDSEFRRRSSQFFYRHSFAKPGKEITADVTYNVGKREIESWVRNEYFNVDGSVAASPSLVENYGSSNNNQLTIQADYVNPISETQKLEMGIRSFRAYDENILDAFSVQPIGHIKLPLSNHYEYTERVNAAYVTYTGVLGSIGYQAGLRAEYSQFDGTLIDSARKFGYEYPEKLKNFWDALFPSLYLSKKIGDDQEMQLNFSRRIRRPRFWQINPFIDINDPQNIRQGNPSIRPEYTNSFEFNYSVNYNTGNFLGAIYFRNNVGDITSYSDTLTAEQYAQLNNAAVEPNAILNTFINANHTNRAGLELVLQQKLGKSLELIPGFNLQYRKVVADVKNVNLSNEGMNWQAELMANYSVISKKSALNNIRFQLTAEYESPRVMAQGKSKEQYGVDIAARKEFLKNNRAALVFAVNDLFNTKRWGAIYDTEQFYQDAYRRWNVRSFRLTFSYKFGKNDVNLFNGREGRRGNREDRDD